MDMHRRDMLKKVLQTSGAFFAGGLLGSQYKHTGRVPKGLQADTMQPLQCGWIDDPVARQSFIESQEKAFLNQQNQAINGSGKGKVVLLHKLFEGVTGGPLVPHFQEIGDCVGHGFGLGIDVLTAVRIAMFGKLERWVTKVATEIIYAGSRIEAGGRTRKRRNIDGTTGVRAAKFVRNWGVLLRKAYLNGAYDYTNYSGSLSRKLGKSGVPDALEPLCREHPVKTCAIVQSWEECRDSVANGHPVVMCSNTGFKTTRDRDGFLRRTRRPWFHAMLIHGIDDSYRRPGGLVQNSWGADWVDGPTRHAQPAGSFWVDAHTIDRAMKQGDSIALSGYVGYPRVEIPSYEIW